MEISWFALFWVTFAIAVAEIVVILILSPRVDERSKAAESYRVALNRELAKGDDLRLKNDDLEEEILRLRAEKRELTAARDDLQNKLAAEQEHKRDVASRLLDATTKLEIIRDTLGPQVNGPSDDQIAAVESADRWLKAKARTQKCPDCCLPILLDSE